MGSIISCICANCGYEQGVPFGGGKFSRGSYYYLVYCGYPAIDSLRKEIVAFNYFKKDTKPEHIKLFDEEGAYDNSFERGYLDYWGDVQLYDAKYYCPKCNSFAVKLEYSGCWD